MTIIFTDHKQNGCNIRVYQKVPAGTADAKAAMEKKIRAIRALPMIEFAEAINKIDEVVMVQVERAGYGVMAGK